jgi:alpha,alpha-trehalose-phosphate synthase [UDP-forming]
MVPLTDIAAGGRPRLLVVSNRGPVELRRGPLGFRAVRTVGGLATALDDVMREHQGVWIAWSGRPEQIDLPAADLGYGLRHVRLKEREVSQYYVGLANQVLWPLCHSFPTRCRFQRSFWVAYRQANEKFAAQLIDEAHAGDVIWIQDFHLALVPALARGVLARHPIGLFWHVPWPPVAVFSIMPWREEVLTGMLGADLIGFQTEDYCHNFLDSVETLLGLTVSRDTMTIRHGERRVQVAALPIGIDSRAFARLAAEPETQEKVRRLRQQITAERIILGVDRLDYTKGILERLLGFERLLDRHPEYRRTLCLVQVAVPSRTRVEDYRELKRSVEEAVGRIAGRFTFEGWVPIRYLYTSLSREQLVPYYAAADVSLVTPLRDGMNLVAKEYVACRTSGDGVLVLSEFAGAAHDLREAVVVNPYDPEAIAAALHRALQMPDADSRRRMRALQAQVCHRDIRWWADTFLARLRATPAGATAATGS